VEDFAEFQADHPLRKVHQPHSDLEWAYYQAGPASSADVVVFCHSTSGTAGAFFYQVRELGAKGYRVLSAQYPAYDAPEDWCKGFDHFLDAMKCRSVHLFGAGLGGFLGQHFASRYPGRVRSLVLCNSFATTHAFADKAGTLASMVHITPTPLLRKVILDAFPEGGMELSAKQAIDWVALQVHDLSGTDLASRLSLNCTPSGVGALQLDQARITIMEANGETMVPDPLRLQLRQTYPHARLAQLKGEGDFPYISRPGEATLFIEVHLRGLGIFAGGVPLAHAAPPVLKEVRSPFGNDSAAAAEPAPRRPWKNPFEDDPLL